MKISSYGSYEMSYIGGIQKKAAGKNEYQSQVSSVQKKKGSSKKKKLVYNHKEISSAIRKSKKANNAALVLTKSKSVLSNLLKHQGTGKYDETELENAITHAKKMVRCAKMKANHLKQEEKQRNSNTQDNQSDRMRKVHVVRAEKRMRREMAEEEIILQQRIKRRQQKMNQNCQNNRDEEKKKLDEADLEYLKRKMERLASSGGTDETVFQDGTDYNMMLETNELPAASDDTVDIAAAADAATGGIDVSL